ncbi:MAG TPA: transposase [Bryobacteraceae bacterium]|nr:transposase [Bryobacteraceae bacterium]
MTPFPNRLPHWQQDRAAYFITWRLAGSLPVSAVADLITTNGAKFIAGDRLLDAASTGPRWLTDPAVARAVISILNRGVSERRYDLGAWVLMPNHIHVTIRPVHGLSSAIGWLKSCTGRDANRILKRTSQPFWARDYFDRRIRDRTAEAKIVRYIENNPVKAGLCATSDEWPWSSLKVHPPSDTLLNLSVTAHPPRDTQR